MGLASPAKRSNSPTLVVGATGNRKQQPGRSCARRSAVSSRNGMPMLNFAGLEPGSKPIHSPSGNGVACRANVDRSAIRSPTTRQRGWKWRGSC